MSETVERVARALVAALHGQHGFDSYNRENLEDHILDGYYDIYDAARAAIAAMRDPTEDMYLAGDQKRCETIQYGCDAEVIWQAMIDAALVDGTATEPKTGTD